MNNLAPWTQNPIMEWKDPRTSTWVKVSDHGRSSLSVPVERLENKQRMANGTLRRYVISKKRTWTVSWENFPDKKVDFLANGDWAGNQMEDFFQEVDGAFQMRLRPGSDRITNPSQPHPEIIVNVMISDFSKEVIRRGPAFDLWSMSVSLEEV